MEKAVDRMDVLEQSTDNSNPELRQLKTQIEKITDRLDGYGLYLYAVILRDLGLREESVGVLVRSVNLSPLNWAAWLLLAKTVSSKEAVDALSLPQHWMQSFFIPQVRIPHYRRILSRPIFYANKFSGLQYTVNTVRFFMNIQGTKYCVHNRETS